jgi:hypothetical protein
VAATRDRAGKERENVALDDYQLPAVERAASFFLRNLGRKLEEVSEWDDLHRWAVLRTSTAPEAGPFDYHVDFRKPPQRQVRRMVWVLNRC